MMASLPHQPVMLVEVVEALTPAKVLTLMPLSDAAVTAAPSSKPPNARLLPLTVTLRRSPPVRTLSPPFQGDWPSARAGSLNHARRKVGSSQSDGVAFDLGLSSPQIDAAERGFSFKNDGPLDMRMERDGPDASDFVTTASPQLERVLRDGEERAARRIARAICTAREETPITRTLQLADIIRAVMPRPKPGQIDPATAASGHPHRDQRRAR